MRQQFRRLATHLTRKVLRPARRSHRDEGAGNLFKRAMLKLTRRVFLTPDHRDQQLTEWEPLHWLRTWEIDAWQNADAMVNEPTRNVNHIVESIFLASISTGFML